MNMLVTASFAAVVLLEIAVPLGLGLWIVRRFGVSWNIFLLGAGFFVAVQILHTPLVLLTQGPLYAYLNGVFTNKLPVLVVFAVYLGLLAGLFEEVGRYLIFTRYLPRKDYALSCENGVMFGAGWGGIESILVALLVLSSMASYIVLSQSPDPFVGLPDDPAVIAQVAALLALTPPDILPGLLERMMTITLHIAWSILVLAAVVRKQRLLLLLAVLWHAGVDAAAVVIAQTEGVWAAEFTIALFTVPGLLVLWWAWRRLGKSERKSVF
ncbi:MAG: YhfC family intramembrane metalloprotease [Methanomicrobiaceae archaeon]|nr:YhfC family intramembrane metalloprotease [Methanomicrobiaceae archaeon]